MSNRSKRKLHESKKIHARSLATQPTMNKVPKKSFFANRLVELRHSLAYIDALPQLTILGMIVGLLTGGIIVVFRKLTEIPLQHFLPDHPENFEALGIADRLMFIFIGIAALSVLLYFLKPKDREMSVSHVMDRMHNHQSKLPFKNWIAQFVGAVIALGSGQSVGREGPVVHLGAGAASLFGQWLKLPNNSINTMVGCGVAAAISASFDTPMAGVIFAMEVLAMEYTIVGFVPVILASVMGTMVSKAVFGGGAFIAEGESTMSSLWEMPVVATVGCVIALCAGVYIRLNIWALKFTRYPIIVRLAIAGLLTALASIWLPQVMGQGYDTVNAAIKGEVFIVSLLAIALVKMCLTPVVIGLGIPGGLIGPLLVIGGCVGGAIGYAATMFFPELGSHPRFYIVLGMAGMMAATLNAPLAALVTVVELSYDPSIIFPAMLVIVVACITTRQIFKVKGIFVEQLIHSKRPLDFGPAKQALRRIGVRSVMDTRFVISPQTIDSEKASSLLARHPMWIIIEDSQQRYSYAMRAADLANYLEDSEDNPDDEKIIDLLEIPSRNFRIAAIHESASLYEGMQSLSKDGNEVLYITGVPTAYSGEVKGLLTLPAIENYYKPLEFQNAVD